MLFTQVQTLDTPGVEWSALVPFLVVLGGAIVLMVGGSLLPRRLEHGWHAGFTVLTAGVAIATAVPLWFRTRDDGPILAVAEAVRVDGLAIFLTVVIAAGTCGASASRARRPTS